MRAKANEALDDVRNGRLRGSAVLSISETDDQS